MQKQTRIKLLYLLIIITGICFFILRLCSLQETADSLVINEVCSNNFSAQKDGNGNYPDYIEIYNPGGEPVSLDGCFLSDDSSKLWKYSLDGLSVEAGGYCVIWLSREGGSDGESSAQSVGEVFGISDGGDEIFLSRSLQKTAAGDRQEGSAAENGVNFSETEMKVLDSVQVPTLSYNTSYARTVDGAGEWARMTTTAGASNAGAESVRQIALEEPVFSAESGFYEEAFGLELTAPEEGQIIYYTLDGSEPDADSFVFQEIIEIEDAGARDNIYAARTDLSPTSDYVPDFKVDKATVVRAVCYDPERELYSDVVTKVYFVGFEDKAEYSGLAVVSLTVDPADLFDEERGIYGNGQALEEYKRLGGEQDGEILASFVDAEGNTRHRYMASNAFNEGKEWEREASLSWFDEAHTYCFSQEVGIRISGQSTRGTPQKSFNIFGRDIYDSATAFPYEFFDGTEYSTIKLRNGGSDNKGSKIKDAFLASLCEERDVSIQHSRPCILFLNGEYWGIYNLRERYKEEYLENYYGVNPDNVWIVESGNANVGGEQAQSAYNYMVEWISAVDMSLEENYREACELIDVQSLIDYYCINLYVDNQDVSFGQNMALWRTAEPEDAEAGDCRWRWMLFDMDISMVSYESNTFAFSPRRDGNDMMEEPVIQSLMANETFRQQFYDSFLEIADTVFSYDRVHKNLMEWKETYEEQVVKNHRRFFDAEFCQEDFEAYIAEMDDFFRKRYEPAVEYLEAEMALYGAADGTEENVLEGDGEG